MADYHTKQRQRNLIVGGFVVIAIFAFIYMLMKFRDLPLFVSKFQSFELLVKFPEAPGIQKDTPVNYCGVQIGRVRHVGAPQVIQTPSGRPTHQVGVTLSINEDYFDIPEDVDVVIMKRGLGSSYIELRDVAQANPSGYLSDGMELKGKVSMASEFFPPDVQKKLENLVDSIAALTRNMNTVLGDADNQTHVKQTLENVSLATANLNTVIGDAENQANIKQMLENVTLATAQARQTFASIQTLSETGTEQVQVLADRIGQVTGQLDGALSQMRQLMAKIDAGEGTAGKLVNDGRLYENLLESSQELETMLELLKQWAADAREKGIRIKW